MEKDLAGALKDFYKELLKPELDGIKGDLAGKDERLTEIASRLQDLSALLGRLEESLTASALVGDDSEETLDAELKRVLEENP